MLEVKHDRCVSVYRRVCFSDATVTGVGVRMPSLRVRVCLRVCVCECDYCGSSVTGLFCLRVSMRDRTPRLTLVETRRVTESEGGACEQDFCDGGRATRHFWYRNCSGGERERERKMETAIKTRQNPVDYNISFSEVKKHTKSLKLNKYHVRKLGQQSCRKIPHSHPSLQPGTHEMKSHTK